MSQPRTVIFTVITLLVSALLRDNARAQIAEFLALDSEGTASVYTDSVSRTAYLLDGGRKGSLVRPRLDNKPVLAALIDRGTKHLVVTCSHPHDDHAGGLLEIIDADANIRRFESITFVDADYPQAESLYKRFVQRWPDYPPDKVRYQSARKRDAFASFRPSEGGCKPSNFVYEPKEPLHPHGHSIITMTDLRKNGARAKVVDFDDASSALVTEWADWAKALPAERRPDIVIAPHHSSDLTDISPLLDPAIRPKTCVITANSDNRFVHPGPTNWLKLVESLGVENVHVTATGNIVVTENGIPPLSKESYDRIRSRVITPLVARVQKDRAVAQEERFINDSQSLQRRVTRADERIRTLAALNVKYGGSETDFPAVNSPQFSSVPSHADSSSSSSSSSSGGGSSSTRNGTDEYRKLSQELSKKADQTTRSANVRSASPGVRGARFRASRVGAPIFGGVIFGNSTSEASARPIRAKIILQKESNEENDAREIPVLYVVARQAGKEIEGYWSDATPTELWAAYHVVRPKSEWKLHSGECGIVGKVGEDEWESGWRFAIHPAIADTVLAVSAMRLDMFPAVITDHEKWQDVARLLPTTFESYRWVDERARITIANGNVQVVPETGPDKCLLRLRFWQIPTTVKGRAIYELLEERIENRLIAFKKAHNRPASDEEEDDIKEEEVTKIEDQFGVEPEYDQQTFLRTAFHRFEAIQSMERFARAVAIMNWLSDSLGKDLPQWPATSAPITRPVVAELSFDDVLSVKE